MDSRANKTVYYLVNSVGLIAFGYNLWYQVCYLFEEYSPSHYVTTPGTINITTVDYVGIALAVFFLIVTAFFMAALLRGEEILKHGKLKTAVLILGVVLIVAFVSFYTWAALTIRIQF